MDINTPGGWVAGVQEDVLRRSLVVVLGQRGYDSTRVVTGLNADGATIENVPKDAIAPTLSIPVDAARALLDALAQHFGGTGDSRQLRRDYDAERGRVDKLIAHLIDRGMVRP